MFRPFPLFLGLRYSRSRKQSGFIRFISASSLIGIALGVMALILGLSAMNGFERELEQRVLSVIPHGEFETVERPIANWQEQLQALAEQPGINATAPLVLLNGLIEGGERLKGVQLRGIIPEAERHISKAENFITGKGFSELTAGEQGVILGQSIAAKLGVKIGDNVTLLLPTASKQGLAQPRRFPLRVVALLQLGGQLDSLLGYVHLNDAQAMANLGEQISGVSMQVDQVFNAQQIVLRAANEFPHYVYIRSWMSTQGHLYRDIQMVRTIMIVVMLLVVAVACFNIVSTLVLSVREKRGEIAILKTMGATLWQIRATFVVAGMVNGLLGALIGAILGGTLAHYLTPIIKELEQLLGHRFLNPEIYFVDFLPTELHWGDLFLVTGVAILMSFVATLYPAWQASKLVPARELGH